MYNTTRAVFKSAFTRVITRVNERLNCSYNSAIALRNFFGLSFYSYMIFIVISMRFLPLVALAATLSVGPAISEDLLFSDSPPDLSFSDSQADMSIFQDTSQDLLASQNLLEDSTLTTDDDDIFNEASDLHSDLPVSCSIQDGQSLSKLRSRDGSTVCSPPDSTTPSELRPLRDAWDAIQKWRNRILTPDPASDEPPPPPAKKPWHTEDSRCEPYFPIHLCCADQVRIYMGGPTPKGPYSGSMYDYGFCANGW